MAADSRMAKENQERRMDRQNTEEVMDSKSKHHLGQGGVEDRISQLPGALRCHILSLMPTLYAVRTTILSKSWNKLWTSVPNLDFDQDDFSSFQTNGHRVWCPFEKFATFVDCVLSFHDSSSIQKFRIHCLHVYSCEHVHRIHGWICAATTRYNTVELDLNIYSPYSEWKLLPKSVITCKTLVVLKVRILGLCDPNLNLTLTSSLFPSLKSLHYSYNIPDNASLEKLLSNCHSLEDLTIDGCIFGRDVYNLKISAPALKTLRILGSVYRDSHEFSLSINAPKLEDLVVKGNAYCLPNYCLVGVKSLTKARICFGSERDLSSDHFDRVVLALLARVSNVEYLSLSTPTIIAGSLPQCFNNLKRLEMALFSYSYWDYVVELLKRSPNLEDLALHFHPCRWNNIKEYVEAYEPFIPPKFVPVCVLSHLKTIFIRDFLGHDDEFEVMKYLLKYGEVLEKITISTHRLFIFDTRHMTEDKFRKKCLKIQKLSKTCEVEVKFRTNRVRKRTFHECERVFKCLDIEDE